jgi:2-amino-4-hydroxy-6-hydroxymethyldihydropteridine diphosphokinase
MTRAFLGLGSNVGDRQHYLREAVDTLGDADIGLQAVSPIYETEPVGGPDQGRYLNVVVELDTELTARELLGVCRRIESAAGRVRGERWGPRTLDVDVLWIDGVEIDEPDLTVPHRRMWERRFVLTPLRDLAPDLVDSDAVGHAEGHVDYVGPFE